jgi:hypothetical protein
VTRPRDPRLEDLQRRLAGLEAALERARSQPRGRTPRREGSAWLGAAALIAATWTLSAQAPAAPADLEGRVRALEALIRRNARGSVEIKAPLEIVEATGKPIVRVGGQHDGSVPVIITTVPQSGGGLLSVSAGGAVQAVMAAPGEKGVISALDASQVIRAQMAGSGYITVHDPKGVQIAGVTQGEGNVGRLGIWRGDSRAVDITGDPANGGGGVVNVNTAAGKSVARVGTANGAGEVLVSSGTGPLVRVGADAQNGGAGGVKVMTAAGKITAALLGGVRGAGSVVVAGSSGRPAAELSVSSAGHGLVQIFNGASDPVAVLSESATGIGGLLQISNGHVPVTSIYSSDAGAGRWMLNDNAGVTAVEAGVTTTGRGMIAAGPKYQCGPVPGMGVVPSPVTSCIVGLMK